MVIHIRKEYAQMHRSVLPPSYLSSIKKLAALLHVERNKGMECDLEQCGMKRRKNKNMKEQESLKRKIWNYKKLDK